MADLTVTAASVIAGSNAKTVAGTFGATITAGKAVYQDTSDNKWKLADANLSAAAAVLGGIALNGGSDGQPALIQTGGNINPGATVVVGTIYVLSATAGGICPAADLVSGMYTNIVGIGTTSSNIAMQVQNGLVAVP